MNHRFSDRDSGSSDEPNFSDINKTSLSYDQIQNISRRKIPSNGNSQDQAEPPQYNRASEENERSAPNRRTTNSQGASNLSMNEQQLLQMR